MFDHVLFLGSKQFGLSCLKTIRKASPDTPLTVGTIDQSSDARDIPEAFEAYCRSEDIPLIMLPQGKGVHELVKGIHPTLCVVSGWYRLLRAETLALAPKGFIGTHASLLPKYRGGAPLVWAIINGETHTGTTLFRFDEGMDTGDVIGQKRFDIMSDDTIADLVSKAESASVELLEKYFSSVLQGTACLHPQAHKEASYCSQRTPADGRIDWTQSARQIHDFIRAQTKPYPGAFFLNSANDEVRVWKAEVFPYACSGSIGQVMCINDDTVVCCGDGAITLCEVQAPASEICPASDLLRQGDRLR